MSVMRQLGETEAGYGASSSPGCSGDRVYRAADVRRQPADLDTRLSLCVCARARGIQCTFTKGGVL